MSLEEVETALAAGQLWAGTRDGRWYEVRRNGKTQLWRTRPTHYRIPAKARLRDYVQITHESVVGRLGEEGARACDYMVAPFNPTVSKMQSRKGESL